MKSFWKASQNTICMASLMLERLREKKFKVKGAILADQVKSLDWKVRKAEFFDKIPEAVILEALKKFATLLRIDNGM
ncbi:hypothetical protein EPICR_120018 [Candidatus Desulfarcum epimagneticum]|uniref:Uncharacterized protein n=1 Tax=uncultured Desulfobacteraceae bacterium TaxID=218296 RepID=A0A484HCW9_9BACT|nr:hypothetical protein EPICR_120018 [uncultured Desulfobacteraceae bacterium]